MSHAQGLHPIGAQYQAGLVHFLLRILSDEVSWDRNIYICEIPTPWVVRNSTSASPVDSGTSPVCVVTSSVPSVSGKLSSHSLRCFLVALHYHHPVNYPSFLRYPFLLRPCGPTFRRPISNIIWRNSGTWDVSKSFLMCFDAWEMSSVCRAPRVY